MEQLAYEAIWLQLCLQSRFDIGKLIMRADEAKAMLAVFASVGARAFILTLTDIKGDKIPARYTPAWMRPNLDTGRLPNLDLDELRQRIGLVLQDAEQNRHNVIIRPLSTTAKLIQLDDLDLAKTARITSQAFIAFSTSPANYQAWVAVKDAPVENEAAKAFVRRLRNGIGGSDKSATGATRIAGSLNFKPAYAPNFPTVEVVAINAGNITSTAALDRAGLLAAEEPPAPPRVTARNFHHRNDIARGKPNYQRALDGAPLKSDGKPDRSRADYMYCIWAIDRGMTIEQAAAALLEDSEKAQDNKRRGDKGYALVTAKNAADAVERRGGPRPKSKPRPS